MKYPDETIMVVCQPLFISLAERFARDFGRVLLYVPVSGSFPTANQGLVGTGIEGVERVYSIFGPHFEDVSTFCFPDLGFADFQVQLETMGKNVFGNRNSEELELYREFAKEQMERDGLPVQTWKKIIGIDALREHLKANPNQHCKLNIWRGATESFFSPSYEIVETKIDDLAHTLGCFGKDFLFIVEDDLPDMPEIGIDSYCIDGRWPSQALVGIEVKDAYFAGQMCEWEKIPEPIRRWNDVTALLLGKYGGRGFISTENRIDDQNEPYPIDLTIRAPSPPNELFQELFTNISEIVREGARGVLVDPIPAAKWGVEVIIKSAWAEKNQLPVKIPDQFLQQVKLYNYSVVDGIRYVIPQDEEMSECGAVVGWGDTLEEAVEHAKEAGEAIEGYGIKFNMGPVDAANEQMEELADMGISPFTIAKDEK